MNRFFTVLLSIIFITIGCSRRMYNEDPIRRVQRYNSGGFEVQAYTDVNESNLYENLIVSGVIRLGDTNEKASNTSVNFKSEKGELIGSTVTDSDGVFKMELSTSDFSGKVEFAKGLYKYTIPNIDMGQYFKKYKFNIRLQIQYAIAAVYFPLTKEEHREIQKKVRERENHQK